MSILIAGVGDLGRLVWQRLQAQSYSVNAFSRSGRFGALRADLSDAAQMRLLARKHDVVLFCAAPDTRDEAAYRRLYLDSLQPFLESDIRIVYCASTAVYDIDNGAWCDERTVIDATRLAFNGRVLLQAESQLRSADLSLRLGGIYGPGRDYALRQVRAGVAGKIGLWTNRIHIEDAADAIVRLLSIKAVGTINLVDSEPCTQADQYAFLRDLYQLPAVPPEMTTASGKRVSNAKLLESGFTFRYPSYREGYAALKI